MLFVSGNRENSHEVSILQDPISLNTDQSFADVKNVYYVTAPRSKIIIEYTDDDSYNTYEKGYDSSRESTVEGMSNNGYFILTYYMAKIKLTVLTKFEIVKMWKEKIL